MKMRHHSKLTVSRRLELYKPMGVGRHKRRVRPGFHHNKAIVAAAFQLVCGAGALTLGTIAVLTNSWGYYFGCGFWGGSFFMAAGLCGIVAGIRKNNTPITIFVVFSGIAFVLAVIMLALASVGISPHHVLHDEAKVIHGSSVVILSLHIFTAIIEILASVSSIAIALRAICVTPHSDRQYEIAVQSPVSSEFAPQVPQARSNSYGQYELCSDFDTEFTVSEGLTPLAPSSQLPTTCTEELPILSSVLENNLTPDDSTCLLQQCTEPDTLLDSPAVSSITAQEENAVNDLLENSPVGPPGTPPPSYQQVAKRGGSQKSNTKSSVGKADTKGKTASSRVRSQDKKPIAPLAKPPSGPTRRSRTTSEPGMKKSASQTSNRSMQSAASSSRQSSIRSRSDSSRKEAEGGSPAKHKRPSHLDIPPKGTSSRTRGQVRSRSSRTSAAGSQATSSAKPVARGASQSQRGARTPSSRAGAAPATSSSGPNARGLTRTSSRSLTSSLKGASGSQKTAQDRKSTESASNATAGSAATKTTKGNQPTRTTTSSRARPGSQSSAGGSRPRNPTGTRAEGSGSQRSPLDTLL